MQVSPKRTAWICVGLGVVLLSFAGWLWWAKVYQSPENVFWGTLENNLSTMSVTKHTRQQANGQTIDQYAQLVAGIQNAAIWRTTIKDSRSTVITESVGTPTAGYVRYIDIHTSQQTQSGHAFSFKSILNEWAKATPADNTSLTSLYDQTLLDVNSAPTPPIGYVSSDQRQKLIDFMRQNDVFSTPYSDVKHQTVNGRQAYVYTVSVPLSSYVALMQQFAHDRNVHSLDNADPSQYQTAEPVTITMAMSPTSHQLIQVTYEKGGFTQDYSAYGTHVAPAVPSHTIPIAELESRLQKLQQ